MADLRRQKRNNISIALIDASPLSVADDDDDAVRGVSQYDPRVVALTQQSQRLLDDAGIWSGLPEARLSPYHHMHVWDANGTSAIDFDAALVHQKNIGHIVENAQVVKAIEAQLAGEAGCQWFRPVSLEQLEVCEQAAKLKLSSGDVIHAGLVIAADGAHSPIRQQLGVATREWDYLHQAIVTTVEVERSHQNTAWQVFLDSGPLAFLPLASQPSNEIDVEDGPDRHFCSIVWSCIPERAQALMALDDAEFKVQLERAFEAKLGKVLAVDQRFSIPLRQRHAVNYVSERVALVGDAAHTIHPLAGQGVNLGLKDVSALVAELSRAQARGLPLWHTSVLARYQRQRKGDNLQTMLAMEALERLYDCGNIMVRWLRNEGVKQVQKQPLLKRKIIEQAMGLG